jgi:ABC-type amino acid transport substrate-binding protein
LLALGFALATLFPSGAQAQQKKAAKPAAAKSAPAKATKLVLGYYANGRPFSYDDGGKPAGYAVELCEKIAGQMKAQPAMAALEVSWMQVTPANRAAMLRDGKVNVICGEPDRLSSRAEMAFSIPIFQSGVGALLRGDAPLALAKALSERPGPSAPLWRGTPTEQLLQAQTLAVISGSPAETALAEGLAKQQLTAKVVPVKDFSEGVQAVLERKANVFFTDRSMLLDAAKRDARGSELLVLQRRFTVAPIALAVKRGDEGARLALDRALSRLYAAPEFRADYAKWFGEPDADALAFFRAVALPE